MEFKAGKGPSRTPRDTAGSNAIGYIWITAVVIVVTVIIYVLFSQAGYNPTGWVFGDTSKVKQPYFIPTSKTTTYQQTPTEDPQIKTPTEQRQAIMEHIPQQRANNGEYYQYKDKNGVVSFTDNQASIPADAEAKNWNGSHTNAKIEVLKGQGRETRVTVENDRVYVPVKIRSAGAERNLLLLMDTGATSLVVYQDAITGIKLSSVKNSSATLANGIQVHQLAGNVDSVSIGPAVARDFEIRVMQQTGQKDHQGLLGMSFLKNFHYTLDMNRKIIRWN